jgi:hypothetical protein
MERLCVYPTVAVPNVATTSAALQTAAWSAERSRRKGNDSKLNDSRDGGIETMAAILSSLISICRRHNIDPQHYLTQLLTNLPATPISQLSDWLPDQWQRQNPSPSG